MTMLVAVDENKKLIHIDDAERGLACQCTCFECGEALLHKPSLGRLFSNIISK